MNPEQLALIFINAYRTKQPATPPWEHIPIKNQQGVIAGIEAVIAKLNEIQHHQTAAAA